MHESGALLLDPQDLYRLDRTLYSQEASCSERPSQQGECLPSLGLCCCTNHGCWSCVRPALVRTTSIGKSAGELDPVCRFLSAAGLCKVQILGLGFSFQTES